MLKLVEERHAHQRRNGRARTPYAEHCKGAAQILEEAIAKECVADPTIVENMYLATLGHDLYEDGKPKVTPDYIVKNYGAAVDALIEKVTNRKSDQDRVEYLEKLRDADDEPMLIKYADQIDNVESVIAHLDDFEPDELGPIIKMLDDNFAVMKDHEFSTGWTVAGSSLKARLTRAMKQLSQSS